MRVYLSCDRRNRLFKDSVQNAVTSVQTSNPDVNIELTSPSFGLGALTGRVESNVLLIASSDLIVFDVTPAKQKDLRYGDFFIFNAGVMIEYGLVLALQNTSQYLRFPNRSYIIYCWQNIPWGTLTPIFNVNDIKRYPRSRAGGRSIETKVEELLRNKIVERSNLTYTPIQ